MAAQPRHRTTSSQKRKSSIRNNMPFDDCTICLNAAMRPSDNAHPLQCSERRCGYNFCQRCIESLITSSKDDYMEASDGNKHVKVFLHCPNCRSDLTHTIRDTLLLRKADGIDEGTVENGDDDDDHIHRREQLKEALLKPEVQAAIREARKLEALYLGTEIEPHDDDDGNSDSEDSDDCMAGTHVEEMGFEADLTNGVHQSFRAPKAPTPKVVTKLHTMIDPCLFRGLDYFMTEEERMSVSEQMVSGEPSQLCEAAQTCLAISNRIKNKDSNNNTEPTVCTSSSRATVSTVHRPPMAKRSSVFQLIEEAQEAHMQHNDKQTMTMTTLLDNNNNNNNLSATTAQKRAHRQRLNKDLKHQAKFQKLYPLPVRMPKSIEVDLRKVFELQFIDHTWDGTVMDAFSKISIGYTGAVSQKSPAHHRVPLVVGATTTAATATDLNEARIELPNQPRVLVSRVDRVAGKQGVMKGDVVTHINNVSVEGKSAMEVLLRIHKQKRMRRYALQITFNAERSVAEALKRRAMMIADESS